MKATKVFAEVKTLEQAVDLSNVIYSKERKFDEQQDEIKFDVLLNIPIDNTNKTFYISNNTDENDEIFELSSANAIRH
jgi:hypothetical protein